MAKKKNGNGGTALAVIDHAAYPALDPKSDMAEAIMANMQGAQIQESDLVRVPTPAGGGTRWVVPTVSGEEVTEELAGILVYFARRGVLWPTEEVGDNRPLLLSTDLVTATRIGDDYGDVDSDELEKYRLFDSEPAQYDWLNLPQNQWGSGKNGIGKRCKESRLLFLLRENEPFPLVVRAQPGSLKTIRPFIMRLPVPHWRAVVTLRLTVAKSRGGPDYAQIIPTLAGMLPKEVGEQIKKLYTEPLRAMTSGMMAADRESDD